MRPADRAWLALAAGIIAWDALCPRGEMLSDASRRYTARRPIAWTALVVYVAGHLIHVWPRRVDPLSALASRLER